MSGHTSQIGTLKLPISGVKLYTECESRIDLTGFS
jgi:hypothetical protein